MFPLAELFCYTAGVHPEGMPVALLFDAAICNCSELLDGWEYHTAVFAFLHCGTDNHHISFQILSCSNPPSLTLKSQAHTDQYILLHNS